MNALGERTSSVGCTPQYGVLGCLGIQLISFSMGIDDGPGLRPEDLQARVGRAASAVRKGKAMTQEEIASRAGIGWRHLQKIEAGEVNTTLRTICCLATALEVDPSIFFQDEHAS